MKRIYKNILKFFGNLVGKTENIKTYIAEWIAIFRKTGLYKDIKWTTEQQKEFDDYWTLNYGKKISNRWHKLYEAANGVCHIDYLPEIVFSTKIEPMLNNYTYCVVYSDKDLNSVFFNNRIVEARTPECYVSNNHGRFYDSQRHLISKEKAIEILSNVGEAVIKPTVDSSSGKNVIIVNMQNGKNIRNNDSAEEIINNYKTNFIVQEKIKPCKELMTLYPLSVNTIRVISYILNDEIHIAPISLRIGGNGGEVDNIHAGGLSIAVSNDGYLAKYAYRLGYGNSFEKHEVHPDTKVKFKGYKLSFIDKIIATAKRLHEMTANIGIISWDFTVDNNGNVIVIETNLKGQSAWFPQMLSERTLFGDNTADILRLLKNK